jgi:hypothetical protein
VRVKAVKPSGTIAEEELNDQTTTLRNADGKRDEKRVESDAERKERWRKQAVFFFNSKESSKAHSSVLFTAPNSSLHVCFVRVHACMHARATTMVPVANRGVPGTLNSKPKTLKTVVHGK